MSEPVGYTSLYHDARSIAIGSAVIAVVMAIAVAVLLRGNHLSLKGLVGCGAVGSVAILFFVTSAIVMCRQKGRVQVLRRRFLPLLSLMRRSRQIMARAAHRSTTFHSQPISRQPSIHADDRLFSRTNSIYEDALTDQFEAPCLPVNETAPVDDPFTIWRELELAPRIKEFSQLKINFAALRAKVDSNYQFLTENELYEHTQKIAQLEAALAELFEETYDKSDIADHLFVLDTLLSDSVGSIRDMKDENKKKLRAWYATEKLVLIAMEGKIRKNFLNHVSVGNFDMQIFNPIAHDYVDTPAHALLIEFSLSAYDTLYAYAEAGSPFQAAVDEVLNQLRESGEQGMDALKRINELLRDASS